MKKFALLVLSLCAVMAFWSCSERQYVAERLATAEQLMAGGRPDSALYALQSVDPASIRSASQLYHYHLRLAQAKDKCFIDETEPSILLEVVDYYLKHNDADKLFDAYFYLGKIYQNAGNHSEAMCCFLEAEQIIDRVDGDLMKGLLYAHFGQLNEKQMNFPTALEAFQQAEIYYRSAGSVPHVQYTALDIGNISFRIGDYTSAAETLREVMEWAYAEGFTYVAADSFDRLCMTYEAMSDFQALDELLASDYAKVDTDSMIYSLTMAYKYARDKDTSKMEHCLKHAWENAVYPTDTATIYHREYQIHKYIGRYEDALYAHERLLSAQDSIVKVSLQNSLEQTRTDYFETKLSFARYQSRNRLITGVLIIAVLLLAISLLAVYFRTMIRRKDRQIEDYMAVAADMRSMEAAVSELFSKQYKLLDKLSVVYYETHGTSRDKDAIYKQVKTEIERFTTDKKFLSELENIVDSHRNGVMRKVRAEFPHWGEMDFRLLCFFYAGFSAKAISVFTGDSTGNIYVKKSRLKKEMLSKCSYIESF